MAEPVKTTFDQINDFITAVAHLLWPIIILVIALLFKREISGLLKRLRKGKFFGQELELEKEILEFKDITEKAFNSIPQIEKEIKPVAEDDIDKILSKYASDPKLGIIMLSQQIEKELINITASIGLLQGLQRKPARQAFELLAEKNYITSATLNSVKAFWDLRNQIVHGRVIEDEGQVIRILDVGVTLLNTLKAIPHTKNIVYKINVEVFSDSKCQNKRLDVVGLILERASTGRIQKGYSIFPTRRRDYEEGTEVAWEWSFEHIWQDTWYRDHTTNSIKPAWASAAEFVGRPIKEL